MARETLNTVIVDESPDRGDRSGSFGDHDRVPSAPPIRRDQDLPAVTGELLEGWETPYVPEFPSSGADGLPQPRRGRGSRRRREKRGPDQHGQEEFEPVTTKTTGGTVVTFPPQNAPGTTAPGEPGDIGRITASIPATPVADRPVVQTPTPEPLPEDNGVVEDSPSLLTDEPLPAPEPFAWAPDIESAPSQPERESPPPSPPETEPTLITPPPSLDAHAPPRAPVVEPPSAEQESAPDLGSLPPPQPILFYSGPDPLPSQESPEPSADAVREDRPHLFASRTFEQSATAPTAKETKPRPQELPWQTRNDQRLERAPEPVAEDPIDLRDEIPPAPVEPTPAIATPVSPKLDEFEDEESLEELLADLSAATGQPSPPPDLELASRPEPEVIPDHAPSSHEPALAEHPAQEPVEHPAQEPVEQFEWDLTPPLAPLEERPPSLMEMLAPPIDDIRFAPPSASAPVVNPPPPADVNPPLPVETNPPPLADVSPPLPVEANPPHVADLAPPAPSAPVHQAEPPAPVLPTEQIDLVGADPFVDVDPVATVEVTPRIEAAVEPMLVQPESEIQRDFSALPSGTHADPGTPLFDSRAGQPPEAPTVSNPQERDEKSAAEAFASETSLLPAKTRRGDVRVVGSSDGGSWFTKSGELPIIQVAGEKPRRRRRRLRRFFRKLMTGLLLCAVLGAALFAALNTIYL